MLVVDDEPAVAAHVSSIVEDCGHRVSACHTWTEALRAFGRGDVDLVLMDAVMPTVDGFKLTRILRSRASTYVPIVFLTGLDDANARANGIDAGADDFLSKPIDALELRVRMTAMLRIRSLTKALEEKTRTLSRIASMDALTGIGNRRSFDERIHSELKQAAGTGGPLAVLLLDIDHFKAVNDTFGHQVGDDLLRAFGRLLAESTRACDLPYRYGGEEFAILCPNSTAAAACHLAERVRSAFELRSKDASAAGSRTCSIGVAGTDVTGHHSAPDELIAAADGALYRAKDSGRNCVCVYDAHFDAKAA
ncbi:MAG: diguanylate cyclase [Myxococcota bacterium]